MELNEKFMEVIFQIIIKQNTVLLKEIALKENIPFKELSDLFLRTPRKNFTQFIKNYSSSSG